MKIEGRLVANGDQAEEKGNYWAMKVIKLCACMNMSQ